MSAGRENEFSWSVSRDDVFRRCLRRYYYAYYASWGGWAEDAPALTKELYLLKNLKSRPMWVGDLVHRAIRRSLTNLSRGVAVLPPDRVAEITLNLMRNEYRASRRGEYRASRRTGLFEHEYDLPVSDEEWRDTAVSLERCLRNFYASSLYRELSTRPKKDFLEVETLSFFTLGGTRCWVILDLAFRDERGIVIADWKTGQAEPGGYELQLTGYALYAAERWQVEPAEVSLLEYNLFHDKVYRHHADRATVERTASYIQGSIADMKSLLADQADNHPFPEERFGKVEKREVCGDCPFQRVCRPRLA